MQRYSLAATLYVALVFLSGALVGAFGYRLYRVNTVNSGPAPPSPEEWRRQYIEDMRVRVGLNADQTSKVQAILDETRRRYRILHERTRPEMKAIQDEQVRKINSLLNEQQRGEYEKLRDERERKRQQERKSRPGP